MNIAIMIYSMDIGGAERAALLLAEHLKTRGENVLFFFLGRYGKCFMCPYDSYELPYNNDKKYSLTPKKELMRAARAMRNYKKVMNIDVSISFMEESNYINILSHINERVILSVRTTLSARKELNDIIYDPRLIRIVYNRAYAVVAVSDYTRNDLIANYGIKKEKVVSIPNVSLKYETSEKKPWKYGKDVIIHVGRLDPVKQQDRIIRAFSYVKKRYENAILLIIGDGALHKYLDMISQKMKVDDSVHILGFQEDIAYYLKNAKVFVMASKAEGFPNSMVEAMAYGIPIITTDSPGGCGEIVGKNIECKDVELCQYGIVTPYMEGKASREVSLDYGEIILGKVMLSLLRDQNLHYVYSGRSKKRSMSYSRETIMRKWDNIIFKKGK